MKFDYEYRTSDNKLHNGVIRAANRDDAFASLKSRGIRPVRVIDSPGFFNKLLGKGKRWTAIIVLAISLLVAVMILVFRPVREVALPEYDIDSAVIERLAAMGHSAEDINDFLESRRKLNEEYRARVESQVNDGRMTKSDANDLLVAIGLAPLD